MTPERRLYVKDDVYPFFPELVEHVHERKFRHRADNYPGVRTDTLKDPINAFFKQEIETQLGVPIAEWPELGWLRGADNCCAQSIQHSRAGAQGRFHHDVSEWAGVFYVNPFVDTRCGTRFGRHKPTGLTEVRADTPDLNKIPYVAEDWETINEIAYRPNRLIIYPGAWYHAQALMGWGHNIQTSRLTITFFFNTTQLNQFSRDKEHWLEQQTTNWGF